MKKFFLHILALSIWAVCDAQDLKVAPEGFDVERKGISKGQVDTVLYPSKTVGVERSALIYKPPGYTDSKKYPVLYLLHGIGGDEWEWYRNGAPHVVLDNLYDDGKIVPMIVVLPNGRAMKDDRAVGNIMDKDKVAAFDTFEKDLLNDLIPFVDRQYSVRTDRGSRALFGLSMGGGQALNFGLRNLDTFAWVGGFSSAPNLKAPEELASSILDGKKKLKLLWLSVGENDNLKDYTIRTHNYFKEKGIPHQYYLEPGGHDFLVWKNDLYQISQLIFK